MRLLVAVGLVLAVSGMAMGGNIPLKNLPGDLAPVQFHYNNYDDTVIYSWNKAEPNDPNYDANDPDAGYLADNTTKIVLGTAYDPALVAKSFTGINLDPNNGEDSWGIFKIDQGLLSEITGPNNIKPVNPNVEIYNSTDDHGLEVVGMFYGGHDLSVTFDTPGETGQQTIEQEGAKYEIFVQPANTYNNGGTAFLNDGASLRVDENEYPGIGYDGTGTNTLMPGAIRVLTLETQPGMADVTQFATFNPDDTGASGDGTFGTYLSLVPLAEAFNSDLTSAGFVGTDNSEWDTNPFPTIGAVPSIPGTTADFRLKGTTETTFKEWVVASSDPLTGAVVPEPLTMLGVLMAAGSLGGYIRKRRNA